MRRLLIILSVAWAVACSDSTAAEAEPVQPPVAGEEETGKPTADSSGSLFADGTTDTYALIRRCGYEYETPDQSGDHAQTPVRHIEQVWDEELGRHVFRFTIHVDNDDDRGKPEITDRQRNEIKTDSKSPDNMVASYGETHVYTWYFKLPAGMRATQNFCHVHQLKGYGGNDIASPLITLSVRKKSSGREFFQVIYTKPEKGGTQYLSEVALSDFLGQWVEVTERVTFADDGRYSLTVKRVADQKTLIEIDNQTLALWRAGAEGMRPKYGIYRSFGAGGSLKPELRDEALLFADFTLTEE